MRVLITGGAGYIGSVATKVLSEAGHEVIVLDNLSEGYEDAVPEGIRLIRAEVADVGRVIKKQDKIEAVIHLAAFTAAGESMVKPERYWQNNVISTLSMLEGMRSLAIKKLVFASTAAVYGNPETTPIPESAATRPASTYGMTKLTMDMAITSECVAHGLAATSLRFFNVAGAYEGVGERHDPETHLIPLILQVLAGKRDVFNLYGTDYPTPDGTCVRDYIHVADLADAMLLALDILEPSKHTIYNLGNGDGFSNKQVIAAAEKVTGKTLPVTISPRREGDPAILIASSERARQMLGWQPKRPKLEAMIADAWRFMTEENKA